MTKMRWTLMAVAGFAAVGLLGASPASAADGKELFTQHKCNMCHTVDSQGIAQSKEEGEDADESKPVDLSNVGSERDVKWLKDWLNKKAQIDGKTHRKTFKGAPADLDTLATWLATLKKAK